MQFMLEGTYLNQINIEQNIRVIQLSLFNTEKSKEKSKNEIL